MTEPASPKPNTPAPSESRLKAALPSLVVLFSGLFALAGLSLWLNRELNTKKGNVGDKKPVATLDTGLKSVQRKLDKEVLWEDVAVGEPLYNRDAIRTAEGSEAKIKFDDGTVLELSENSLVILDRSEDKVGIEFLKGSVFARGGGTKGKSVEIQTSSGKVKVGEGDQKGALALTAGKAGLEVAVQEGTAQLQTDKGSAAIGANEKGSVGAAGGIQKQKIQLFPKLPIANARLILQDGQAKVAFTWEVAKGAPLKDVRLQVASDPEFVKILVSKSGTAGAGGLLVADSVLAEGSYYWRVVGLDGTAVADASEKRLIKLVRHAPVRLESPDAGLRAAYFRERPSQKFKWRTLKGGAGGLDRVEVSRDRGFKDLVPPAGTLRTPASARGDILSEAQFPGLANGSYFWRVVTRYEEVGLDGKGVLEIPTEIREYSLAQLDRLPTPDAVEPEEGESLALTAAQKTVALSWRPITEAGSYRVRVASDPQFQKIILDQVTASPEWEGELAAVGTLYWDAQALVERPPSPKPAQQDSQRSKARSFSLSRSGGFKLVQPSKGQKFEFVGKQPEITFAWEGMNGVAKYEVQFASDEQFRSLTGVIKTPGAQVKTGGAPVGDRYWRVRALDASGNVLALSEGGRYLLREVPLLAAPEKVAPNAQAKYGAEPPPRLKFEWKPIAGATGYVFTLHRQGAGGKSEEVASQELPGTSLERVVQDGVYTWDVRAVDTYKRRGEAAAARQLEVKMPDRLAAPNLVSPSVGAKIEGLTPQPVLFKWDTVSGAQGYVWSLYRIDGSKSADGKTVKQKVKEVRSPKPELQITEALPSGQYFWEVAAVGKVGTGAAAKERLGEPANAGLTLKWVGLLSAPSKVKVRVEDDDEDRKPATGGGR